MKKVTITEFKDNLSALLAKAARGEEIVICDRKKPYVRVVALFQDSGVGSAGVQEDNTRLLRLESDGLVSRRKRSSMHAVLRRERPRSRASVVDALIEERGREL